MKINVTRNMVVGNDAGVPTIFRKGTTPDVSQAVFDRLRRADAAKPYVDIYAKPSRADKKARRA